MSHHRHNFEMEFPYPDPLRWRLRCSVCGATTDSIHEAARMTIDSIEIEREESHSTAVRYAIVFALCFVIAFVVVWMVLR